MMIQKSVIYLSCVIISAFLSYHASSYKYSAGGIALLDHLNINHEKGRHDLLKQFYIDTLGLAIDPRKLEKIEKGKGGVWANCGITQFHLGEGEPSAQVHHGTITLAYKFSDFSIVKENLLKSKSLHSLMGTKFNWKEEDCNRIRVTDPWGSTFLLLVDDTCEDPRGCQPGAKSLPVLMSDLTFFVPAEINLEGIERFYKYVFDAPSILSPSREEIKMVVSPYQTLTFSKIYEKYVTSETHAELTRDVNGKIISNSGPHISLYVKDMEKCFQRLQELGGIFVNTRFKRQAYNLEEALDQCMFRCIEIIDPENKKEGPIIFLEHEVRSMKNRDGSKYKSCPILE